MYLIPRGQSPCNKRRIPPCDRSRRNLSQLHKQRPLLADASGVHMGRHQVLKVADGRAHIVNDPFPDQAAAGRSSDAIIALSSGPGSTLLQTVARFSGHRRHQYNQLCEIAEKCQCPQFAMVAHEQSLQKNHYE